MTSCYLPEIIGFPGSMTADGDMPEAAEMRAHIIRTMPIAYITPMKQAGHLGLEVFKVESAWEEYVKYLKLNEINIGQMGRKVNASQKLAVMYQEQSMGESYSNQFSQSALLAGLSEGVPESLHDIQFMTGMNGQQLLAAGKEKGGMAGSLAAGAEAAIAGGKSMLTAAVNEKFATQMTNAVISGNKIDFPMMWRGSGYSATYDLTVRLYCPAPANDDMYNTCIVGSYGALLALVLPRTADKDAFTYQWPFLVGLQIPGLVSMEAGYLSSLVVVKGGDVMDRSWIGRPGIVDIRLTFSPLYNVALMTKGTEPESASPTLLKEVHAMQEQTGKITAANEIFGNGGGDGGFIDQLNQTPPLGSKPTTVGTNPANTSTPGPSKAAQEAAGKTG